MYNLLIIYSFKILHCLSEINSFSSMGGGRGRNIKKVDAVYFFAVSHSSRN